ncbi:DUF192 domain-containing protein [Nesterenkonia alba]|uniref:DUF192 domain-containing protein n=1 Tax=Nesterenkonia alba TaxID=515814 RepID=UPI0003B6C1E2|nr:DUF192 domain-containing protein [Nesterenkonia alba]
MAAKPPTPLARVHRAAHTVQLRTPAGEVFEVPFAGTAWRRLKGLLPGGETLLLYPCRSVHGVGMRQRLEVAYLDQQLCIVDIARLQPGGFHRPRWSAVAAWEAPPGFFREHGLVPGNRLNLMESPVGRQVS